MKSKTILWVIVILFIFIIAAGLLFGGWWFLRSRGTPADAPPQSPVLVFLLNPADGSEAQAGDYIPVSMKATAPTAILGSELFVDGVSLGLVTDQPENAGWTWHPLTPGVHTLYATATAMDGETGQSQQVIVNVLAGSGSFQVPAGEGQTLVQIGSEYGVPGDQMAAANPKVDPNQGLPEGQPVQVPVGDGGNGGDNGQQNGGGSGNGTDPQGPAIDWELKLKEPADLSYCYLKNGGGNWQKVPKDPFQFFQGQDNFYKQMDIILQPQADVLQVQCWGWVAGVLKLLGKAEAPMDFNQQISPVVAVGDGFDFIGVPQFPSDPINFLDQNTKIKPPSSLREPTDASDCTSHSIPLLGAFICKSLFEAQVQEYIILEWEWQPETLCWAGLCNYGINAIDGYHVYEIDPFTQKTTLMKDVTNPDQKVTALPLPWGARCYGVTAFVNNPSIPESEMTTYCPGNAPAPQHASITAISDWVTSGGTWIVDGCDEYGLLDSYVYDNQQTGFGNQAGQVQAGSYVTDNAVCYLEGNYSAGIRFNLQQPAIPAGAFIQKAVLSFKTVNMLYGAAGVASPTPTTCVSGVGYAGKDWTSLVGANHYTSKYIASIPIASLSAYSNPQVDVTLQVRGWFNYPDTNHGFILRQAPAPYPAVDGDGNCISKLGNFTLLIDYYTP